MGRRARQSPAPGQRPTPRPLAAGVGRVLSRLGLVAAHALEPVPDGGGPLRKGISDEARKQARERFLQFSKRVAVTFRGVAGTGSRRREFDPRDAKAGPCARIAPPGLPLTPPLPLHLRCIALRSRPTRDRSSVPASSRFSCATRASWRRGSCRNRTGRSQAPRPATMPSSAASGRRSSPTRPEWWTRHRPPRQCVGSSSGTAEVRTLQQRGRRGTRLRRMLPDRCQAAPPPSRDSCTSGKHVPLNLPAQAVSALQQQTVRDFARLWPCPSRGRHGMHRLPARAACRSVG